MARKQQAEGSRSQRSRTPERTGAASQVPSGAGGRRAAEDSKPQKRGSVAKESKAGKEGGANSKLAEATPGNIQEEGFIDAFYQPRSFSGLLLLIAFVVYVTMYDQARLLEGTNRVKSGILLAGLAFLIYCGVQLRDGHLLRPHPVVWRLVHGTGLLYFLLLVFLMCQELEGIHTFLQLFDERVGQPQGEHSYGDDCRLYAEEKENPWENIENQIYDRFMVAHFLGWAVKALILRDWTLMWVASVLFEVLETTFQHMYPNFNECWWDHLLLDVFGCNFIGMIIGMVLVDYMGTHQFTWTGQRVESISGTFGKMKRVALQFTPRSFDSYRWQVFDSWRRFAIAVSILIILLLGEMNAFFIKSTFGIPIDSDINLYRLTFWVFMTYMATFEFYWFADGRSRRVGVNSWLAGSLVSLETLLVLKHTIFTRNDIAPALYIQYGWFATFALFVLTGLVKASRRLLVRLAGAQEVQVGDPEPKPEPKPVKKPRASSMDMMEETVPGSSFYVRAGRRLDKAFRYLTFLIPVPLTIVLLMDCYRTYYMHPPPSPGPKNNMLGW